MIIILIKALYCIYLSIYIAPLSAWAFQVRYQCV